MTMALTSANKTKVLQVCYAQIIRNSFTTVKVGSKFTLSKYCQDLIGAIVSNVAVNSIVYVGREDRNDGIGYNVRIGDFQYHAKLLHNGWFIQEEL